MRHLIVLVLMLGLVVSGCGGGHKIPRVGDLAPDFTLVDRRGKTWTLSQLRGQVVFVNFWATWCPPCRQELPYMQGLFTQMAGKDFQVLALLNKDEVDLADDMAREKGLEFPILDDTKGEVGVRYGLTGLPETFIVDKKGIIRKKVLGAAHWNAPEMIQYFTELMNQ